MPKREETRNGDAPVLVLRWEDMIECHTADERGEAAPAPLAETQRPAGMEVHRKEEPCLKELANGRLPNTWTFTPQGMKKIAARVYSKKTIERACQMQLGDETEKGWLDNSLHCTARDRRVSARISSRVFGATCQKFNKKYKSNRLR